VAAVGDPTKLANTSYTLGRALKSMDTDYASSPEFRISLFSTANSPYFNISMSFSIADVPSEVVQMLLEPPNNDSAVLRRPLTMPTPVLLPPVAL
jgi:hypothetical protein